LFDIVIPDNQTEGGSTVEIDLGDIFLDVNLRLKDQPVKPRSVLKLGVHQKTVPADRVPVIPQPYSPTTGKVDRIMNLASDKKVKILGMVDVDEMGHEIGASADQPTYTTDDAAGQFIVLTDNGDGTGEIAATGELGSAQVTATFPDDSTLVETVNTVVGEMASRAFKFGPPEEVTPDE
jgi:hypothetical protein